MEEHLKRIIGVVGLAAAVVNITIGPAIFVFIHTLAFGDLFFNEFI